MELSVVLPVKNEPKLNAFIDDLNFTLQNYDYEIVVVMGDKETLHPALTLRETVKVYTSYADSLERAILLGLSVSQGEKIIVMDADGSHPIDHISQMYRLLDEYEMVAATRFFTKQKVNNTVFRSISSYAFSFMAKLMGTALNDPMTGYFGIQKDILKKVKFKPYTWKVALEIDIKAKPLLYNFPIIFGERNAGESKATVKIGMKLIKDMTSELFFK